MISMAKYLTLFKVDTTDTNSNINIPSVESKDVVGLKILTTTHVTKTTNQVHSEPIIFQRNQIPSSCRFLKSCYLCHKHLSPNKDIYMYRGDQCFCSEECRSRQIYLDEVKELEISTKKMIQQFRQSRKGSYCDTRHSNPLRQKSMASPIFS